MRLQKNSGQRKVAKHHREQRLFGNPSLERRPLHRPTKPVMAALQAPRALRCLRIAPVSQRAIVSPLCAKRSSSSAATAEAPAPEITDIELDSGLTVPGPSPEIKEAFKPWKRQMERRKGLPGSRCVTLSPSPFFQS